MDQRRVVHVGIEAKQRESEPILTARLAVTRPRIAAEAGEERLDVGLEGHGGSRFGGVAGRRGREGEEKCEVKSDQCKVQSGGEATCWDTLHFAACTFHFSLAFEEVVFDSR